VEEKDALETLRTAVLQAFPEHAASDFRLHVAGWDSFAVDVDDRTIFKFPRRAQADARLRNEAKLLSVVRPSITMPVPEIVLHEGPPLFTRHEKLKGEHLLAEHYGGLSEAAKQRLAGEMARFFAELHAFDAEVMRAAGAGPIGTWLPPDEILRQAWPLLPSGLRGYAERSVAAYAALPPDPLGITFGYFDGHGWNMAFDHKEQRLNGVFDFGDSGFGPLHMEFVQSSWISRDHVERVVTGYERLTGRTLDRERIELLSGVLRLSELGGFANDPEKIPGGVRAVAEWAEKHR
jgi:Ser/Thr protein kinase RdoA (MazF antagonist)